MNPILPSPALASPLAESTLMRIQRPMPHAGIPAHTIPARATPQQPNVTPAAITGKAAAEANEVHQPQPTSEEKAAGRLRTVKSVFMLPAQMEFAGMLGGGALGWLAKKTGFKRTEAAIRIASRAPVHAMRTTTLADAFQLPSNFFKEASEEAGKIGGRKTDKWATSLQGRSEKWMETPKGTATKDGLETRVANKAKPYVERMNTRLDEIEKGGFGKKLTARLNKFFNGRHTAVVKKHNNAIAEATRALETEAVGFWKKTKSLATFTKYEPSTIHQGGALSFVFKGIADSEELPPAARPEHLRGVLKSVEDLLQGDSLKDEAKSRAGTVMKHLQKAVGSAESLENYGQAIKGGTLRDMVGAAVKTVGKVKIFNALLGVGVIAGLGAVMVTGHGESKKSKAAFKKITAELADKPNSVFLKSLKAAQMSRKHWGVAKTGLSLASETAEGAMWMLPNGGGMGMMGAMALPQIVGTLVPENAMLSALEALRKNDAGELQLRPSDRIQLFTQIIGGMESVKQHGGAYNRLGKAMAAEIQARGLNYREAVQLLGDDAAFNKLASDVSSKQQIEATKAAAELKAAAPAVATGAKTAAANNNVVIANDNGAAPMMAAAPTTRIAVGATATQHDGVVMNNRHVAVG